MHERRRVLLTVSGVIPDDLDDQVASGRRPRADYRVLAERLHADVVDVAVARRTTGRVGTWLEKAAGPGALLAWYAFKYRRRYEVILTDGEQVGLPLALLCRLCGRSGARHVMIVHVLSTPRKEWLIRATFIAPLIDRYIVYCTRQFEFVRDQLGVNPTRIVLTPFMVDTKFFSADEVQVSPRHMICTAGLERRDYPTLMEAVAGLDVEIVIAAASPWSRQTDSSEGRPLPDNVRIERLDLFDLRQLYATSRFVVMPLLEVDFQAGITAILEAMAMSRSVVCTRTVGQTDTVIDGQTGLYVPAGDAAALRVAIQRLLTDDAEAATFGAQARTWAVEHAELDRYVDRLSDVVRSVASTTSSRAVPRFPP